MQGTRARSGNGLATAAAVAIIVAALVLIGILVSTSITAHNSESTSSGSGCDKYGFSVPFVCGFNPSATVRILPGFYATSVMIHNPSSRNVEFKKKISLTFPPPNQAPGFVSEAIEDSLDECQALMVDCEEILGDFGLNPQQLPPYIIGVLSVTSERALQVSQEQTVNGFTFPQDEAPSGIQKKKDEKPSGTQKGNGPPPGPPPPPPAIIGSGAPSVSQLQVAGHCV